jgi:hypothetical protein
VQTVGPRRFKLLIFTALLVFSAALGSMFCEIWRNPLSEFILTPAHKQLNVLTLPDHRFTVWNVSRNAYTLATPHTRLFNAEQCHPAPNSLAFGHALITLGILGVPAYLATGDPVITYNFAFIALMLISAMAMYFLVAEWTAVPAAGIVAGLIYAFHPSKLDLLHPFFDDTAWTVLALLFARRFFAHGRWLDAVAASVSCSLQAASSFYPFLAAVTLSITLLPWLILAYGIKKLRLAPCLVTLGILTAAMLLVFRPYLELQSSSDTLTASKQMFAGWWTLLPWNTVGWLGAALVLASLALGRRRTVGGIDGDPRWALVLGSVLAALMAIGGNEGARVMARHLGQPPPVALPNLYAMLATVVPGLESVRAPANLDSGVHLALSILSGLGAAALLRLAPHRLIPYLAASLVLVCWIDTARPTVLGMEPRVTYKLFRARPSEESIEFFETLEKMGNDGPILELPIALRNQYYFWIRVSSQVLLSAYHHRPTSSCANSFLPPVVFELEALAKQLPSGIALERFHQMGFTTIVIHHPPEDEVRPDLLQSFERAAAKPASLLQRIHGNDSMTAFALVRS